MWQLKATVRDLSQRPETSVIDELRKVTERMTGIQDKLAGLMVNASDME
jgi:hypothetical protein